MTDKLIGARNEWTEELFAPTPHEAKEQLLYQQQYTRNSCKLESSKNAGSSLNIGTDIYGKPANYSQEDVKAGVRNIAIKYA